MIDTYPLLRQISFPPLQRKTLHTLQVNLGYVCNQQCLHCHVNASPYRHEIMQPQTLAQVIKFVSAHADLIKQVDLTGGAPELNPGFRDLVTQLRAIGVAIIDRCNLTILEQPGQEDLAEFLADHKIEITASLPCYAKDNVDAQRGAGVFDKSLSALKRLNRLGYGTSPDLCLNLVFNPQGPVLPPAQAELEIDYKKQLKEQWDIEFNHLLTLTNMPIKRFGSTLVSKNGFDDYLTLLKNSHQDENLQSVMCLDLISIDWQGYVYDCDFNQMLDMPLINNQTKLHISQLDLAQLEGRNIQVAGHCYACTAGQGSSCGGALV